MGIDLYSICWNEATILDFFFRHYDPIVERYIIYDDGSTDGTLDILHAHPRVEVRRFERVVPDSYVLSAREIHNHAWKETRGTGRWVMISAIDEHLYHPTDLAGYLASIRKAGVTLAPALGYQMVAAEVPPRDAVLTRDLTRGAAWSQMSKLTLFDPDAVRETNFEVGRHSASPQGKLVFPERDELLNLHYKYLGLEYLLERNRILRTGLGEQDVANQWGGQYNNSDERTMQEFASFESRAIDIADPASKAIESYPPNRWWRQEKQKKKRSFWPFARS